MAAGSLIGRAQELKRPPKGISEEERSHVNELCAQMFRVSLDLVNQYGRGEPGVRHTKELKVEIAELGKPTVLTTLEQRTSRVAENLFIHIEGLSETLRIRRFHYDGNIEGRILRMGIEEVEGIAMDEQTALAYKEVVDRVKAQLESG